MFGLSNSAYRTSILRRCLPLAGQPSSIDWLLATRAWALGARLAFDATPRMVYRQDAANIARVLPPFSEAEVRAATERVLGHYRVVLDTPALGDAAGTRGGARPGASSRRGVRGVDSKTAPSTLRRYTEALNALPPRYVWWWPVANPELENVWRN